MENQYEANRFFSLEASTPHQRAGVFEYHGLLCTQQPAQDIKWSRSHMATENWGLPLEKISNSKRHAALRKGRKDIHFSSGRLCFAGTCFPSGWRDISYMKHIGCPFSFPGEVRVDLIGNLTSPGSSPRSDRSVRFHSNYSLQFLFGV